MKAWVWVLVAIVVVVALVAAWAAARKRRSAQLQGTFGPEYERTVSEAGSRREAESELAARAKRRQELEIRPLRPAARERYLAQWQSTQASFVDRPVEALQEAHRLVLEVMTERGYPTDDFEQRAADVSVDHPDVVSNFREAHEISQASRTGTVTTEQLRQGMVHYRSLFEELLQTEDSGTAG